MEDLLVSIDNAIKTCDQNSLFGILQLMQFEVTKGQEQQIAIQKILQENLKDIINNVEAEKMDLTLKTISEIIDIKPFMKDNFTAIIERTDTAIIPEIVNVLFTLGLNKEIMEHFEIILQACEDKCVYQLVQVIKKVPDIQLKLEQYCNEIIEKSTGSALIFLIRELKGSEKLNYQIKENACNIIQRISDYDIPMLVPELETVMSAKEVSAYTKELISCCRTSCIVKLIEQMNKKEETKKELQDYKEQLEPIIIECCTGYSKEQLEQEEIYDFIKIIFKEIQENEDTDLLDIKEIGNGQFSKGYQIGEKVIKFGDFRATEQIPYHRRILQPILRRPVYSKTRDKQLFYIEISETVENSKQISITEDDVYQVYKELRNDGIIWTDAKSKNLGRLKKPNLVHMKNFNEVDDNSLRYHTRRKQKRNITSRRISYIRYRSY